MSAGHRVQVDQDFQLKFFRPFKRSIQIFIAVNVRPNILKDEERHRNPHRVESVIGNLRKITALNEGIPEGFQPFPGPIFTQIMAEIGFIRRCGAVKQRWRHPFFQYQPTTKVHALQHHVPSFSSWVER